MAQTLRRGIKLSGTLLFGAYVAALIYCHFFAEGYGRVDGVYDYNVRPFREIWRYLRYWKILGIRTVVLNLGGNILGFVPFGALLPLMVRDTRKAWKVGLLGLEISALVEFSQLIFRVGCFDVDDMILNTFGALAGYGCFWLSRKWFFRRFPEEEMR